MFLFLDSETNGKIKDMSRPMTDVDNFPRVTQLAWQLYDKDHLLIIEQQEMILPDGWEIPNEKFFIDNNMSTERCRETGLPIQKVLARFLLDLNRCEYMVAHNFAFDYPIIGAEMIRAGMRAEKKLKGICTMKSTTDFCKLPSNYGKGGFKWPKLEELHKILFDAEMENAHDALYDVSITAKCFFECLKRNIIKL